LAFIQIIYNSKDKTDYVSYNDNIVNLYGYSYAKNKKFVLEEFKGIFDKNDVDENSFPIFTNKQKSSFSLANSSLRARIVKMKDLSTSYKKDDICKDS